MNIVKYAAYTAMLLIVSCRFLIDWFPLLNLPILSTLLAGILYFCLIVCFFYAASRKGMLSFSMNYKLLLFLYTIYSFYLIYYIIISPQLKRDNMLGIPGIDSVVIQSILTIALLMLLVNVFKNQISSIVFAKITVLVICITGLFYFLNNDLLQYTYLRALYSGADFNEQIRSDGMINPLSLDRYLGICFFCNLYLKEKWTESESLNKLIFWTIASVVFVVIVLLGQRGPILFVISTTLFYYFCINKKTFKTGIRFIFISISLLILSYMVITYVSDEVLERFMLLSEDGGSGRIGEHSEYEIAWNQIQSGPLFGSYFRSLDSYRLGSYPHNLILEFLMTFGIVFALPMILLLLNGIKNTFKDIRENKPEAFYGIIFVFLVSCYFTSGSVALDMQFWLFFALVVNHRQNIKKEIIIK